MFRRFADLFRAHVGPFSDHPIGVFDDVLGHLIQRTDSPATRRTRWASRTCQNAHERDHASLASKKTAYRKLSKAMPQPVMRFGTFARSHDAVQDCMTKAPAWLISD
jgi:hypothetical protein